jgi:hypothetical protein
MFEIQFLRNFNKHDYFFQSILKIQFGRFQPWSWSPATVTWPGSLRPLGLLVLALLRSTLWQWAVATPMMIVGETLRLAPTMPENRDLEGCCCLPEWNTFIDYIFKECRCPNGLACAIINRYNSRKNNQSTRSLYFIHIMALTNS